MITPETFLKVVGSKTSKEDQEPPARLALVSAGYAGGRPKLRFDGEDEDTVKEYPYLGSYVPAAGDRVLLLRVGHTWVIIGEVV